MLIWLHLKTPKRTLPPRNKDISLWANSNSISSSSILRISSKDSRDPLIFLSPMLMRETTWSWSNHHISQTSNNGNNVREWLTYRVTSPTNDQNTSSSLIVRTIMAIVNKVSNSFKIHNKFKFQIWHPLQANLSRRGYKLLWKTTNSTTLVHRRSSPHRHIHTIKLHKVCATTAPPKHPKLLARISRQGKHNKRVTCPWVC